MSSTAHQLENNRRLKRKNRCPLSDPSIGIISENDHKVGLCLCKYCDCGLHKCSSRYSNLYPKSAYSSKYQHDYQRSQFDVPLKADPKLYIRNTAKMDLTTTNQVEYQRRAPTPEVSRSFTLSPQKKEIAKITAYASDYPDWGPTLVNHEKTWHPPVRSVDLTFAGKSSYKGQFHEFDQSQIDLYRTEITQANPSGSTFALAPKDRLYDKTTYSEKMKDYSTSGLNSIVCVRASPMTPTPATPVHFRTTFQEHYKSHTPVSKDPRQLRHNMQSQTLRKRKSLHSH